MLSFTPNILSVIVTYNRLNLLVRCINALQNQTYQNQTILVINNSSIDGTEEYLINNKINCITQTNGGSSAGWYTGIAKAIEGNYDFVWMMDDDGFPEQYALEILIQNFTQDTVALSSLVVKENYPSQFVFGLPILNKNSLPILFSKKRKYNSLAELKSDTIKYPHIHPFNGTLLHVQSCKKIGNIDKEYFMYGDEVDYNYRLRKIGKVFTVINALHYHPDVSNRNLEDKKVYYFIRNSIILNHLYFDVAVIRDVAVIFSALHMIYQRNGFNALLKYLIGKNKKYFYPAIIDSIKNKRGKKY